MKENKKRRLLAFLAIGAGSCLIFKNKINDPDNELLAEPDEEDDFEGFKLGIFDRLEDAAEKIEVAGKIKKAASTLKGIMTPEQYKADSNNWLEIWD